MAKLLDAPPACFDIGWDLDSFSLGFKFELFDQLFINRRFSRC